MTNWQKYGDGINNTIIHLAIDTGLDWLWTEKSVHTVFFCRIYAMDDNIILQNKAKRNEICTLRNDSLYFAKILTLWNENLYFAKHLTNYWYFMKR